MDWKESFKKGKELVLSTCSNLKKPNANIVISLGFLKENLVIADCQMQTTIKNLKENPKVCIIGGYFRILGTIEIYSSGEMFDKYSKIVALQDPDIRMKNLIIIKIEEVFDLDETKRVL
jgi:predicted pyridoxine 5'-phosphate oxidase superfamily flavin-nucleotide-binding protein